MCRIECAQKLHLLKKFSNNFSVREHIDATRTDLRKELEVCENSVHETLTAVNCASNALQGAMGGASTASLAWMMATKFGAASTGALLSSLHGAAATNATLAWFGGGSIASGGLGMAGGTAVLGGIVVVPAIVMYSALAHWKASKVVKKIEEDISRFSAQKNACVSAYAELVLLEARLQELIKALEFSAKAFENYSSKMYYKIFPWGKLSVLGRQIYCLLTKKPFYTVEEAGEIQKVYKCAKEFIRIIDQLSVDEEGNVIDTPVEILS